MPNRKDSYTFFLKALRRLMDRYEGQYVAVIETSVVAHGTDAERVYLTARKAHPGKRILIGQVPVREAMVLWGASARKSLLAGQVLRL